MNRKIQKILRDFGFKSNEISFLLENVLLLKLCKERELEEKLIVLESLYFKEFQNVIISHPKLLLLPFYIIGEDAQKFLWQYREMEMVRRKILEKRG